MDYSQFHEVFKPDVDTPYDQHLVKDIEAKRKRLYGLLFVDRILKALGITKGTTSSLPSATRCAVKADESCSQGVSATGGEWPVQSAPANLRREAVTAPEDLGPLLPSSRPRRRPQPELSNGGEFRPADGFAAEISDLHEGDLAHGSPPVQCWFLAFHPLCFDASSC